MTLKAVLANKPAGFFAVTPDTPISGVIAMLAEKRIGAVLVVEAPDTLVGILSERDIVRSLASHEGNTLQRKASELMTASPITASPSATVADAMQIMSNGHFRHLPILEAGKLVGVVSIGDVVKARIDQTTHEVESLRTYVGGHV